MRHLIFRCAAAATLAASLAACQSMDQTVKPGMAYADVIAKFGRPNLICSRPDGQQRAIWTTQPMGQFAWGADIGADGRVQRMDSVLTDAHFRQLGTGSWTAEQVRCEFGPPAVIDGVGLPNVRQMVWSYRYKENGVWNSLMYVYMGPQGDHVTGFHPGPDPMYDHNDSFGDR